MRLIVIGAGQCGCRVADEFAKMGRKARSRRGIEIITGAYAVNTDQADLTGLRTIRPDFEHRVLVGGRKTGGHGVGKINEAGAAIAKSEGDKVVNALKTGSRFYETDAFLLIAGAAGGTGSGGLPVFIEMVRERYPGKPVYALLVLPFEHEESSEERCVYNTATCLKTTYSVADAVFLADNQRYLRRDAALLYNMDKINEQIAAPFYDLLCAGEELKRRHIGARTVDAGDIIQTVEGWTILGRGKSDLPLIRLPFERTRNFRKKGRETFKGLQAMDEAIGELSAVCSPKDAGKALYLISAPAKEMNVTLAKELGDLLKEMAADAVIRSGDYPLNRGEISISLILSQLKDVPRVRGFYGKVTESAPLLKKRKEEARWRLRQMDKAAEGVPSLLEDMKD